MKTFSMFTVSLLAVLSILSPTANALTLGEAVDAPELFWATSHHDSWTAQTNDTHDGIDAVKYVTSRFKYYEGSQIGSWLITYLRGPGELSFDWMLDIENQIEWSKLPVLQLLLDNEVVLNISNSTDWVRETISIPEGRHQVKWRTSAGEYSDGLTNYVTSVLDEVNWTGDPAPPKTINDYDGDGITDRCSYYGASGTWYLHTGEREKSLFQFGYAKTVPVAGDYDGDYKTDPALYDASRGQWYFLCSRDGFKTVEFGFPGTQPVRADFDGDYKDDFGVYHPSSGMWYLMCSHVGFRKFQFGFSGTIVRPADFDGDGKADLAVYHDPSGMWFRMMSRDGFRTDQLGGNGCVPVVADFDGDLKDDILCNSSTKNYVLMSRDGRRDYSQSYMSLVSVREHLLWVGVIDDSNKYRLARIHNPALCSDVFSVISGMSYSAGLDPLGVNESKPTGMSIVSGLSADLVTYDEYGYKGGGIVFLGNTSILNSYVSLVAMPSADFEFVGWNDGNTEESRTIQATGYPRHFVATFRHKFQGTWVGRAGTAQVPTSLIINPYYVHAGWPNYENPGWRVKGHILWPNDDKRSLRDIQTSGNAIGFYLGNSSELWRLELNSDGNRLTGKGCKYIYSDNGEREAVYYDVDLRRQ